MHRRSHGAYDTWLKHASLHITTWPNQMCAATRRDTEPRAHRTGFRTHPSCDRNSVGHTEPNMSANLTLSIISG